MAGSGHYNSKGLAAGYDKNQGLTLEELTLEIDRAPETITSGYYKVVESLKSQGILLTKEGHSPNVKYFLSKTEPEEFKYIIYLHKNTINNKTYVGQTRNSTQERWREGGKGYQGQPKFWNAILKYGWENFEHIILEQDLTPEEVDEREKYWIKYYNSIENGYNISAGGSVSKVHSTIKQPKVGKDAPWFGKKHTEEYKEKMSQQMKEKWMNQEYREKTCENMKKNHANFKGGLHPQARAVYCIDKDIEMPSCRDMAEYLQCENPTNGAKGISRVCRGERITYQNLHFVWAEDKENQEKIQMILNKDKNKKGQQIQVQCIETGKIYTSIKEATQDTKVDSSSISRCCKGTQQTAGGLHWIYIAKED